VNRLAPAALALAGAAGAAEAAPPDVRLLAPDVAPTEAPLAAGKAALGAGDPVAALRHFRQALAADPQSTDALNGIAVSFDRLGRFDTARTYYEAALMIAPTSPVLLHNLGYSRFLAGDLEGAGRFLALAATAEDPAIAETSVATLARVSHARVSALALPPRAPEPEAGPRIVRTAPGEQRLVLDGGVAQTMALAIPAWTAADDRRLARAEAQADARDAAAVRAEAEAFLAALAPPAPEWPSALRLALPDPGAVAPFRGFAAPLPEPAGGWAHRLDPPAPPVPGTPRRLHAPGARPLDGLDAIVARPPERARAAAGTVAEPPRARKPFDAPFDSDDPGLNRFAGALHGHTAVPDPVTVAEAVDRLQALLARLGRA
jgi:hypothetical protein